MDKRCLYASVVYGGPTGSTSAVVRAADGRIQHLLKGKVRVLRMCVNMCVFVFCEQQAVGYSINSRAGCMYCVFLVLA